MIRVAVIWANLGPYHVARAKALARQEDVCPTFIQLTSHDKHHSWTAGDGPFSDSVITLAEADNEGFSAKDLERRLACSLENIRPDVVVASGYASPMRAAARWARSNHRACILMSMTTSLDHKRLGWKELIKKWLIRRYFDGALVGGSPQRDYLNSLGMSQDRIWERGNVVDNDHFDQKARLVRLIEQKERKRLGLPEQYLLFVGRFSPEKNLLRLLDAYSRYRDAHPQGWRLVMVGNGPQQEELRERASLSVRGSIHWVKYQQSDQLPSYYSLSSGLILPSTSESWGLVVNEAMACSLPVLVSIRCGCASDLVHQGKNGYTFDPYNISEMAERMSVLASLGEAQRANMGQSSKEIIASYTPESWAASLVHCIATTVARRPRRVDVA